MSVSNSLIVRIGPYTKVLPLIVILCVFAHDVHRERCVSVYYSVILGFTRISIMLVVFQVLPLWCRVVPCDLGITICCMLSDIYIYIYIYIYREYSPICSEYQGHTHTLIEIKLIYYQFFFH